MAIVTISRGSFSKGKEVADRVAGRLGYQSVSREVVLEASRKYQVSQARLDKAIHDAPSLLDRFTYQKQKHIAYVATEILAHFAADNIVYHGLAGHLFAPNVSHLLKVRIIANWEDRLQALMDKNQLRREQAERYLKKDDEERRAWSLQLYGVDTSDINLYDLVIHIDKLTVDNAVELICRTVIQPQFVATAESQEAVDRLALAARTRAALIEEYPSCEVVAEGRTVEVSVRSSVYTDSALAAVIRGKALKVPGVSSVSVKLVPYTLFS